MTNVPSVFGVPKAAFTFQDRDRRVCRSVMTGRVRVAIATKVSALTWALPGDEHACLPYALSTAVVLEFLPCRLTLESLSHGEGRGGVSHIGIIQENVENQSSSIISLAEHSHCTSGYY